MTNSIQSINVKQRPSVKILQKAILEPVDNPGAIKVSHGINPLEFESSPQNKFYVSKPPYAGILWNQKQKQDLPRFCITVCFTFLRKPFHSIFYNLTLNFYIKQNKILYQHTSE